jgi:hypothetical protein
MKGFRDNEWLTELCDNSELRKAEIVVIWITADLAPRYYEETITKVDCVLHRHTGSPYPTSSNGVTSRGTLAAWPRLDLSGCFFFFSLTLFHWLRRLYLGSYGFVLFKIHCVYPDAVLNGKCYNVRGDA